MWTLINSVAKGTITLANFNGHKRSIVNCVWNTAHPEINFQTNQISIARVVNSHEKLESEEKSAYGLFLHWHKILEFLLKCLRIVTSNSKCDLKHAVTFKPSSFLLVNKAYLCDKIEHKQNAHGKLPVETSNRIFIIMTGFRKPLLALKKVLSGITEELF